MKKYSIDELKAIFKQLGYQWFNFHIVGVRAKNHEPNKFQDHIYIVWNNSLYCYSCTTIPGTTYLQKLLNPEGCAVYCPGQYIDAYKVGKHKGNPALVQSATVKVYRDKDLDIYAEKTGEPVNAPEACKLNIHGTYQKWKSILIGGYSAGCQVLNVPDEFDEFMSLCNKVAQDKFTYTLIEEQ